jgi:hypothetical protein
VGKWEVCVWVFHFLGRCTPGRWDPSFPRPHCSPIEKAAESETALCIAAAVATWRRPSCAHTPKFGLTDQADDGICSVCCWYGLVWRSTAARRATKFNHLTPLRRMKRVKLAFRFRLLVESVTYESESASFRGRCTPFRSSGYLFDICKLLKTWSGRPDSNRRRPAWENGCRL